MLALAVWDAISIGWSAVPTLAREEALLVVFYACALAVPIFLLRSDRDRTAALAALVTALAALALARTLRLLRFEGNPEDVYIGGRLAFPISYVNGQGELLLVGFWPAVALAAQRRLPLVLRALALGSAAAMLATLLETQTKGGAIALVVSTVVVFALPTARLRLLAPALIAFAVAAAAFHPLTEPYRARRSGRYLETIHHAAAVLLVVAAVAVVLGLAYAWADRRFAVPARATRAAGVVVVAALVLGLTAGVVGFLAGVDHPGRYVEQRWHDFKTNERNPGATTHFAKLGSNRYDFFRVAARDFTRHPVAGIGTRGFAASYLLHRRSPEAPRRAHSLELDVLGETGVIGFVLLVLAIGGPVVAACRRARSPVVAASLAACAGWLGHASVDWIWTLPPLGLAFFLLLGVASSGEGSRLLPTWPARSAGLGGVLVAALALAPPWLSARETQRGHYDRARTLDPLLVDPDFAEGIATFPYRIEPLRRAVSKEPRRYELRYYLGQAYLQAGRRADARRELTAAVRLDPHDPFVRKALRKARS